MKLRIQIANFCSRGKSSYTLEDVVKGAVWNFYSFILVFFLSVETRRRGKKKLKFSPRITVIDWIATTSKQTNTTRSQTRSSEMIWCQFTEQQEFLVFKFNRNTQNYKISHFVFGLRHLFLYLYAFYTCFKSNFEVKATWLFQGNTRTPLITCLTLFCTTIKTTVH